MSTRILGLLTTTAAVSLTLTGGIAAATAYAAPPPEPAVSDPAPAASAPEAPPPAAEAPAAESPSASPSASPSPSAKELKECADADCEVTVHDGQTIKLDKKYGMDSIRVGIEGSQVTFTIRGENSKMISTVNANQMSNTSATYNGITLRPRMAKDGTMTLKISHD